MASIQQRCSLPMVIDRISRDLALCRLPSRYSAECRARRMIPPASSVPCPSNGVISQGPSLIPGSCSRNWRFSGAPHETTTLFPSPNRKSHGRHVPETGFDAEDVGDSPYQGP